MENQKIYGLKLLNDDKIRYIGKTKIDLIKRLNQHLYFSARTGNNHKNYWINKNKSNIDIVLIEDNIGDLEINEKEKLYVKLFKTFGARLVNSTIGGDGLMNPSIEVRKKISDKNKGKIPHNKGIKGIVKMSKESSKKKRLAMLGRIVWNVSIACSENVKIAISKPVLQFDLNGKFINEWYGMSKAAKDLGLNHRCISMCCAGHQKIHGNFIWKHK